jgi:hypothetical protein
MSGPLDALSFDGVTHENGLLHPPISARPGPGSFGEPLLTGADRYKDAAQSPRLVQYT